MGLVVPVECLRCVSCVIRYMRRSCSHCLHQNVPLLTDLMCMTALVFSTMLLRTHHWWAAGVLPVGGLQGVCKNI